MSKQKITQKENNLFFIGILAGLGGGVLGNLLITSLFETFPMGLSTKVTVFIISFIGFFGFYYWIYKQTKPI